LERKIMYGQSAGRINRKIISEEGAFLWWLEVRPERRKWKRNKSRTRTCIRNLITYNKSTERQT